MPDIDSAQSDRERRLNEAAAKYFELQAAGQTVDSKQWLAQYPELADELAGFLSDLHHFKRQDLRSTNETMSRQAGNSRADDMAKTTSYLNTIGPYVQLEAHARGGLGEILRGFDPVLHRYVAVKRLQDRIADHPDSRRRFLVEAEITARLEHPGIVPVFGLFYEADDRPVYAMRFVQGPTLWDEIQRYHAGIADPVASRRLLQTFVQVCQIVAYAHSRGIIHRDLKPQNIMLGKFGETLVMDWGLARVIGRPEATRAEAVGEATLIPGSGSSHETAMGSAIGTPAYMSPEQAAGRWDVIDHRTDVFGLGAVLYSVLTGKAPLEGSNWPEMQQRIQRGDFPRPRHVSASVNKALEAICLKAMALLPLDRYSSAAAMAIDVEHWLADEPVVAYHDHLITRSVRWLKRHRTLVSAAVIALIFALTAAGAGLFLLEGKNREILVERNAARTAADEAEAINAFLTDDLLGQADPDQNSRDKPVTVDQLLSKSAQKIEGNPKFADRPTVEATLQLVIGKTYAKLTKIPEAEKHLRRALELRRASLGHDDPLTLTTQETLANFLNQLTEHSDEQLAQQTWEARKRVLGPDHRDTLDSLDTYARSVGIRLQKLRQPSDEAVALFRECLANRRRTLGDSDYQTLISMNNLGLILFHRGDSEEAVGLLKQTLAAREKNEFTQEIHGSVLNLADTLFHFGDLEQEEDLLTRYIALFTKHNRADHLYTQNLKGFLARVWLDVGRVDEALPELETLVVERRTTYPDGSWKTATVLVDLGRAQLATEKFAEAEASLSEAREMYRSHAPANDYYLAWADYNYARALLAMQRSDEAEPLLFESVQRLGALKMCPKRHYEQALQVVIQFLETHGRPDDAKSWKLKLEELQASKSSPSP